MNAHGQSLADRAKRALELANDPRWPNCRERTTILAASSMMRGHGYVYSVKVKLPDGHTVLIPERDFNPQTMLWGEGEFPIRRTVPPGGLESLIPLGAMST